MMSSIKQYYLSGLLILTMFAQVSCRSLSSNQSAKKHDDSGWRIGAQAYTFNRFNFFEALGKIDSCALRYVEAYPTQLIGAGIEGKMDFLMSADKRAAVKKMLNEKNIRMASYGVVKALKGNEWRPVFEFCKEMKVETITAEPNIEDLPLLSKLCDEFKINLALHNHPEPSVYWNPDVVLAATKGLSMRVGVCADIGHWVRSGLDPIACLKKLEGRVLHSHMKDLDKKNVKSAHDVHWGTGVCNLSEVVAELKRQNFKGLISVEYEYNWYNNVPDVIASVNYFRSITK